MAGEIHIEGKTVLSILGDAFNTRLVIPVTLDTSFSTVYSLAKYIFTSTVFQ